ncbi:protein AHNAK2 [Neovison vison]|uniref:protein AHNAK2 n=1 Tax=Neovison vison TaxID=452646 RepID=UPI001CF0CA43|nr:protein AHNAK2 [Neogale vison]
MCDCFHMVLPTWPGAPGSVSGRQLQPEEPEAETEDDPSVTEGPVDEIIRPRPQGSSPVYEYVAEGTSFGLPEDTPRRRASSGSGGLRSWWKRDSGDSRTFSRMSRPQEATEVTLMTEVEAGASGYSVTGGGHQGIFVKQVLKDSSAAKLFSLREGDQLLSATVFFDNIKYEDALKILQYSEPYRVQFHVRRKRPAPDDEDVAAGSTQPGLKDREKQDKDVADSSTETPPQTLEGGGDQERLLAKPREGRGRRAQKERLSWPKFQPITSQRRPGPRRSLSSSEASGRRDAPNVSPTGTDTEAPLPAEERESKAGPDSPRRKRFLTLRFRMGSGKGPTLEGRPSGGGPGGALQTAVVEEAGSREDRQKAAEATVLSRREDWMAEGPEGTPALMAELPIEPGAPARGTLPGGASMASRGRKKTKEAKDQEDAVAKGRPGASSAAHEVDGRRQVAQGTEVGIDGSTGRGEGDTRGLHTDFHIQIPNLQTPMFKVSKEKKHDPEGGLTPVPEDRRRRTSEDGERGPEPEAPRKPSGHLPQGEIEGAEGAEAGPRRGARKDGERDRGRTENRRTVLKFNISSFGWSPRKEVRATSGQPTEDLDQEKGGPLTEGTLQTEDKDTLRDRQEEKIRTERRQPSATESQTQKKGEVTLGDKEVDAQAPGARLDADLSLGDKDMASRDSKFKMPKFKMPSFGASAPSKSLEASVDASLPKVQAEVSVPSVQADDKAGEVTVELPSADLEVKTASLGLKLPEGHVPEEELQEPSAGAGLKGHLPKVQMPSIKMPKVDVKAPQVDIKAPKLDLKAAKGEVSAPDVEVSLPSVEVDAQAPGARLDADLSLGDKEVATRDSKFKMPKFKMPSFGVSAPSKDLGTSVDVTVPKVGGEATLPSLGGEARAPEGAVQLAAADIQLPGGELEVSVPEAEVAVSGLKGKAEGVKIKGQLPTVQMPSLKIPKVDIKGPHVDIKAPKLDLKATKGEVSAPDVEVSLPSVEVDAQAPGARLDADMSLGVKDMASRDSKFKMPKFKMPSFGASAPSKSLEASVDASLPKVQAEVSVPSVQADVKAGEVTVELPTADIEVRTASLGLKLPEGHVPEGELQEPSAGAGLKGHLPKVQMPSIKMPKVDVKAPQVDIKAPRLDLKAAKGEVSAPDVEVSLPSVEVDAQAPGARLDGPGARLDADMSLGVKDMASRDSEFKMPKFKMPSFGASAPSKSLEASVDASLPKVQAEVSVPSIQDDVKAGEVTVELPTADIEVRSASLGLKLPEGHVPEGELQEPSAGAGLKGHLPKVQMPSIKMPKVDFKAPQVDIKAPKLDLKAAKGEVSTPDVEVSLPSVEVDAQAPGARLDADLSLGDKEVAARDSKFKMPKFKMPSFGVSAPSKDLGTSVDVTVPKVGGEATLPSLGGEARAPEGAVQLAAADIQLPGGELEVSVPEAEVAVSGLKGKAEGVKIKGQLPTVQKPSLKMPKVDIKAPQVDIKAPQVDIKAPNLDLKAAKGEVSAPDVEVSLPSVEVDAQGPGARLDADLSLGDKDMASRDSKFKMPKFKMPSFGASAPSKSLEASVDASLPKVQAEVSVPSVQADVKAGEVTVELPSADLEVKTASLGLKLPEGHVPEGELQEPSTGAGLKGHLPKVQMPSIKMPKVDFKAPQVDIKAPKLDLKAAKGEVSAPDVEVSLPSVEVDAQAPGARLDADLSLGDKEVAARDSKFKMPKFKMPSFGVSAPSKDLGTSVDVIVPKVGGEATLPSLGGEARGPECAVQLAAADIQLPGGELEVSVPEAEVAVSGLKGKAEGVKIKGQLPTVQMPSLKMPKVDIKAPQVDIKAPQVDIKAPNLDLKAAKWEVSAPDVEVFLPSVEVDAQGPGSRLDADMSLGVKDMASRDSKFKMPKFKMPSFGASAPSKSLEASVDASLPKVQAEVSVPSVQADVKAGEVTVELPTADIEVRTASLGLKLPEVHVPEGELQEPSAGAGLKGHLPKVQMPSIKMPKVDVKAPQVDIKAPRLDLKAAKGEVSAPDVEVSLPSVEVDAQAPGARLDADLSLGDKEVAARDSKFKMPKFKMPSFGVSAPSKDLGTSVDVTVPKVGGEATLPSLGGEAPAPEGAVQLAAADIQLPGGELEVSVPEAEVAVSGLKGKAEGVKIKGQLPTVQMPSLKIPKVDIKGPHVDIKAPKLDLKATKGEVSAPDVEVSLPSVEVDAQAPGARLDADMSLGVKDMASRDSKFKMPKFKMPSFGASAPSKSLEASVDASLPKVQAEVSVPSVQADVKAGEVTVELPSADLEVKTASLGLKLPEGHVPEGELQEPSTGAGLKGHLPKVQMPSIKMPKVDFKAPQVDIKAPKLDLKAAKGEVSAPDVEVSLPSVEVDAQAPGARLDADLSLGDKEVAARDSKFKMPKFKMPSFGVSAPSKDLGTSVDVIVPKVGGEATLPSLGGEARGPEGAVQLAAADIQLPGGELEVSVPEAEVAVSGLKGKAEGVKIKGQLPTVQMPSLKMPKVDIKAPQVDIKAPNLDLKAAKGEVSAPDVEVSLPSVEVDAQGPGARLDADLSLGDKDMASRDSKFKMPKFKMPSFGASAPSKSLEASVDASLPKVQSEVSVPSVQADVKAGEVTVELPSADLEVKTASLGLKLPEGHVPEGELQEPSTGAGLKGHLPKVQMPSIKMPKVDFKAPQVDIKAPKLDLKAAKGEVSAPDVEVSLPSVEVDAQAPGARLDADLSLGDKEVAARDSKFKMPKFKMTSFGMSAPSKDLGTSVDVTVPKVGGEATLPSLGGEAPAPEGAVQLAAADIQLPGGELEVSVPEAEVAVSGLKGKAEGVMIKGQLPTVQMPSLKMPKVDIKAPQVDIKAPKLDLKATKGEVSAPDVEVSLPSVEVDAQGPGARLDADLSRGDKEVAARDSKFKMPKFKMPSFGVSAPSKSLEDSVDASLPKVQAEVSVPSVQADVKPCEVTVELPSADLEVKTASLGLKLPEGHVPEGELQEPSAGAGLKGHLPKVQMPSIKMPKVDFKAPQVDIKAPKLDLKAAKGEVSAPDVEVSLPSVEVDAQAPGARLDADLSLGDKEVAARDSKFKMPKFKMPSFGVSAPSKDLGTSVDVTVPKVGGEATLPSLGGEARAPEGAVQLAAADIQLPGGELEVSVPEAEVAVSGLKGKAEGVKIKGQLPTVQMPSLKMPKVDIKAPQVDIKAPQVDIKAPQVDIKSPQLDLKGSKKVVSAPESDVSVSGVEVDAPVHGSQLAEGMISGDGKDFSTGKTFKISKISVSPSVPSPSKPSGGGKGTALSSSSSLRLPVVSGSDQHLHTEGDVVLSVKGGERSKSKKSYFKLPKVFSPPGKTAKGFAASAEEHEVPSPVSVSASSFEFGHGGPQGPPVASMEASLPMSMLGRLRGPPVELSSLGPCEDVTLTKFQVTVPRGPVPPELPCEAPSGSQMDPPLPSPAGTGDPSSTEHVLLSQPDGSPGPMDTIFPDSYGRVSFPKFHRPKFCLSLSTSGARVAAPGDLACASPTSPQLAVQGLDSSTEEVVARPVPGHLGPPVGISVSEVAEVHAGTAGTAAPGRGVARKGKGSPGSAPRLRLPSLSWSPRKGAETKADPGHSLGDAGALGGWPGGPVPAAEAAADVTLGKEGEAGAVSAAALALLKVAPPGMKASPGGPGLPQGDPGLARSEGGVGGVGAAMGLPEGADVSLQFSETPIPSLDFVQPDLSPEAAAAQGCLAAGPLPLSKHGLSPRDSAQGLGLGAGSASLLCGEGMAALAEEPLPPSLVVGRSEQGAAPGGPRESWFRMPSLGLPSLRRAPKEWAESAGAPGESEAVVPAPATEVGTAKSPQPREPGADGAAVGSPASSYADVLRRNLDPRMPAGPSAPEVRVRPGAGSLPLQLHGPPPAEAGEAPLPAPGGQGLVGGPEGNEGPPSQPEGPLRLRACSTHLPSQVSVVSVGRVWEDSVLRVRIPKLKVPRFSFPAPSSEAVVFVPSVRELSCPQRAPDAALLTSSAGGRGARTPEALPALGPPSESAPICKVRVHIQGVEAASRQVAVHSTVTTVCTELSGPEVSPTQIVRESEVPMSETETLSYGFSLLKGRVPEPPTRARVHVAPADRGPAGHREAQELVVPGPDPTSGDLQPDTGEPFEIIGPSVDEPGPAAGASDLRSGRGRTDSCSDDEPAEIVEFLPEEDPETEGAGARAADDQAPKARPEGKRSSGLFRFWLPSIGFSSSVSETSADSPAGAQGPAPVQTQPGARPPPSQEKGGWFRFPKLGFSSSPTKKSKSAEEEPSPAEENLQEEAGTFYDARESLSPEEPGAGPPAEVVGAGAAPVPR